MADYKILLATHPFGDAGGKPLEILQKTGWELVRNPFQRRLKAGEVGALIRECDAVIAGTEPYDADTLKSASRLKLISRVGIGLDNVNLRYCKERGIKVAYTPEAPSDAVAELTVANILNLLRHVSTSDRSVRENAWNRLMGVLVREVKIGIFGMGRIGSRVAKLLQPFTPAILANDSDPAVHGKEFPGVTWTSPERLLKEADLVTLHIPMNDSNRMFINRAKIATMKTGAMLINTSRGDILEEEALGDALLQGHLAGAALDVYAREPYEGPLTKMDNVILTAHIGASARLSRYNMELEAAENCVAILQNKTIKHDAIKDTFKESP